MLPGLFGVEFEAREQHGARSDPQLRAKGRGDQPDLLSIALDDDRKAHIAKLQKQD